MGHPFRCELRSLAAVAAVVVVVVVVFVVPVALVHLPALLVVVVVGMAPIGAGVGWTLPDTNVPDVAASIVSPVAFSPDKTLTWHGGTDFVAKGWRGAADVDVDLGDGGGGEGGKDKAAGDEVQLPV